MKNFFKFLFVTIILLSSIVAMLNHSEQLYTKYKKHIDPTLQNYGLAIPEFVLPKPEKKGWQPINY